MAFVPFPAVARIDSTDICLCVDSRCDYAAFNELRLKIRDTGEVSERRLSRASGAVLPEAQVATKGCAWASNPRGHSPRSIPGITIAASYAREPL